MPSRINVIDLDVRRRALVARQLMARGFHVEIYEAISEFAETGKKSGLVFISDDFAERPEQRIEAVRRGSDGDLPVVFYGEDPIVEHVVDAIQAGASDYLQWPFSSSVLDKVFRRLSSDSRSRQKEAMRRQARAKVQQLSGRETDVLALLVQGLQNKSIAQTLGISPRTVEIHRANMMGKLGAQSAPDAVRIGLYAGVDEDRATGHVSVAA